MAPVTPELLTSLAVTRGLPRCQTLAAAAGHRRLCQTARPSTPVTTQSARPMISRDSRVRMRSVGDAISAPTKPMMPTAPPPTSAWSPAVTRGVRCDMGVFESRGFTLAITSGDNQTALPASTFGLPLALNVRNAYAEPVDGGVITFTPPASGASADLSSSMVTIAGGIVCVTATANSTVGAYTVLTIAAGAASPVVLHLDNSNPTPTPTATPTDTATNTPTDTPTTTSQTSTGTLPTSTNTPTPTATESAGYHVYLPLIINSGASPAPLVSCIISDTGTVIAAWNPARDLEATLKGASLSRTGFINIQMLMR
jgi:hypothetical protein